MTVQILLDLIQKLETIGYQVVTTVNNMGRGNMGLWKELEDSIDTTFF